ncbi:3-beta-hydroxysteroid dehydrogenase [Luminiphilus syltensis NOR5-1B]|uniref:3-beta-hydroxysteroid dehydrogenase n=1 Tax=Luminiphilus syltensis NOR5-1B TaxID=565045 RepID=B8KS27_9GAMM|nr:SDR family oxidoreductase [Luminiphilus syltensis]EED35292.1 3-beta-hydroxysteroid dehydrogenase [Luminiphilus syltensis NOR5-1B]
MDRVKGKVAIVTGAAGGLGEAITRMLLAEGARVAATDLEVSKLDQQFDEAADTLLKLSHDVTDEASWQAVVEKTVATFGQLDVLVNNAGIVVAGSVEETSLADFRRVQQVHSEGTFLGCKYGLPAMRNTGSGSGSIINMSSVTAIGGFPYVFAYSAAKGAIRSMTKSIAAGTSAAGEPIRCNSIHPGRIETAMVRGLREERERRSGEQEVERGNPSGHPDDIAYMVLYLASDESVLMNGSEIVIDNGATITDGSVKQRVVRDRQ